MNTRKSMTLPIILTFLFICIIIYLFTSIKQTVVTCDKTTTFDSDIRLEETVVANMDGKKINSLHVVKKVSLPSNYPKMEESLTAIKNSFHYTVEYLGDKASCTLSNHSVVTDIEVSQDELVLLDNVSFEDNLGEIGIHINTNTKSSEVIALQVGDTYTNGEFMKALKNKGYSCA